MTTVKQVEELLFALAPRELAQEWDNVGLLVGDGEREVRRVLVALDITETVVDEAIAGGYDLIVAHHPLINCAWVPVQAVRWDQHKGRLLMKLIENRISAICMHTNLDSAQGGVNDAFAYALELREIEQLCEDGLGRIGRLAKPMSVEEFAGYVKEKLGANGVRYAVCGEKSVQRVAVGGGSCSEFASLAATLGCDAFVTADIKYHDFQNAEVLGIHLIDAGHFPTENMICPVVAEKLKRAFVGLEVTLSARHRDIIQYV